MDGNFLNKKEMPTQEQIIRYFFKKEEIDNMTESLEFAIDGPPDLRKLGEPKEIQIAAGTEWEIYRVKWETKDGPKYLMYFKKSEDNNVIPNMDLDFIPNIMPTYDFTTNTSNGFPLNNPLFDYNSGIDDFQDIEPIPFQEQLDYAIETENFKEAARLRDWKKGLSELLKELKPMFIKAIENEDLDAIDRCNDRLYDYRDTL